LARSFLQSRGGKGSAAMNENQSNFDQNSTENSVKVPTIKVGYQQRKLNETIYPFKNLSINRNLLAFAYTLTPAEFFCVIKLWDWFQSTKVKVSEEGDFRFRTSRSHLAEVSGMSEWAAQSTLAALKRNKIILAVSTKFNVSEYVWSCGFLYRGLYEKQTGGDGKTYGPCVEFTRPLLENHTASIIIYSLILPDYIPSYIAFSGHARPVDKSASASVGDIKVALRAGLSIEELRSAFGAGLPLKTIAEALRAGLPLKKVTGLAEAILNTWMAADLGGSFFLNDIMLILQCLKFVNLYESENITAVLFENLKKGERIHEARKKIPSFFNTEEELFDFYLTKFENEREVRQ
jgi:hypothetical protein